MVTAATAASSASRGRPVLLPIERHTIDDRCHGGADRMRRWLVRRLAAAVALGVVSALTIAILFAVHPGLVGGARPLPLDGRIRVHESVDAKFLLVARDDRFAVSAWSVHTLMGREGASGDARDDRALDSIPDWLDAPLLAPFRQAPAGAYVSTAVLITGWPFPCLWSSFELQPSSGYWWFKAMDGIKVRDAPAAPMNLDPLPLAERAIPLRVRWAPFIASATFWTLAWSLPLIVPRMVVRVRRRRHGRCLECGQDRRGIDRRAACPECGRV